jgi:alkylation response protein AidB-like acyl-CoA dehydrogenase
MDTLLSEEEELIKRGAREFFEAECPPSLARAMEHDDLGYAPELWRKLADLGWLGLALPERHGGQGLPLTHLGLFLEELGRAIAPVPFHSTITTALTIARDGSEQQRERILPRVARGELILTWAFTEHDPRLIPEAVRMRAEPEEGGFVLEGSKLFVENWRAARHCLVACRTAEASSANEGLSLFLVDTNAEGITETPLSTIAKDRQSQVEFRGVRVPREHLVGELNEGWSVAEPMLDRATALLCAQLLGASRRHAEFATEYAKNRVAFGRPIGAFQSIAHICADMLIWVDGGDLLTFEALWRMDQGLPAWIEVSQAKAFCNERCLEIGRLANMIHGGIAFIEEFNLNLWFRRIAGMTMRLGTSLEHRARLARSLLDTPGHVQLGDDLYNLPAEAPVAAPA